MEDVNLGIMGITEFSELYVCKKIFKKIESFYFFSFVNIGVINKGFPVRRRFPVSGTYRSGDKVKGCRIGILHSRNVLKRGFPRVQFS